jgi:serine/threonine protein kinase
MINYAGQRFGKYQLSELRGQGTFALVYRGLDTETGAEVAVKIFKGLFPSQESLERLRLEADLSKKLDHPNIVRIHHFAVEQGTAYLVMNYLPYSFRQLYSEGIPLPLHDMTKYLKQVAAALQYAHDKQIVHCDVKPANLLLSQKQQVLLGDFGIARVLTAQDQPQQRIGTPYYMAPEQFQNQALPKSDQYSLGVTLYEWLTGRRPFAGGDLATLMQQHLHVPPEPLRTWLHLPKEVEQVVLRALAKEPEKRFPTIWEFARAFERACQSLTADPTFIFSPPPPHVYTQAGAPPQPAPPFDSSPPTIIATPIGGPLHADGVGGPQKTLSPGQMLKEGDQLGNYRLIGLVGRGGFAWVYQAEHLLLGTRVAIKVLDGNLTSEGLSNFLAEARIMASLEHPNIVRVWDFGTGNNMAYLAMGYAANGSLRSRHPSGTVLPLGTILQYVKQVAGALQYAHEEKVIHLDVKPENLLLGHNTKLLLRDFGIARAVQSLAQQNPPLAAGTLPYMAPEQLQGNPCQASDQYALGVVIYEWLTGARPFTGSPEQIVQQHFQTQPPSLRAKVPDISPHLEEVVLTALAKVPGNRFASISAFVSAFEHACQSVQESAIAIEVPPPEQTDALLNEVGVQAGHLAQTIQRPPESQKPPRTGVFISYSHKDIRYLEQLRLRLDFLLKGQAVEVWDDRMIQTGEKWREQIERAIGSARVAVLLISMDFLLSKFIQEKELPHLLAAAKQDGIKLFPIVVRPCPLEEVQELEELQASNEPSKTVSELLEHEQERLWMGIARSIKEILQPHTK